MRLAVYWVQLLACILCFCILYKSILSSILPSILRWPKWLIISSEIDDFCLVNVNCGGSLHGVYRSLYRIVCCWKRCVVASLLRLIWSYVPAAHINARLYGLKLWGASGYPPWCVSSEWVGEWFIGWLGEEILLRRLLTTAIQSFSRTFHLMLSTLRV